MKICQIEQFPNLPIAVSLFVQLNDVYHIEVSLNPAKPESYILPRVATILAQARKELGHDSVHLCVPGDFLGPSCLSKQFKGEQMVDLLAALGTRFVCFGNHEFDREIGPEHLLDRVNQSDFTWLASNIRFNDSRLAQHPRIRSNATVPLSPASDLLLLGLLYKGSFKDICVADSPEDAARFAMAIQDTAAAQLPFTKPTAYIALSHQTEKQDYCLARNLERLLLIMGGHDHEVLRRQDQQPTMIVKALADARSVRLNFILAVDRNAWEKIPDGRDARSGELSGFLLYSEIVIKFIMRFLAGEPEARPSGRANSRSIAMLDYLGVPGAEFMRTRDVNKLREAIKRPTKGSPKHDAGLLADAARVPKHIWVVGDELVFLFSVAVRTDNTTFERLVPEDQTIRTRIKSWLAKSRESSKRIVRAHARLHVTDKLVRRESTNFGNFVADVVRGLSRARDNTRIIADFGLVNGGSFRLNRDIEAQEPITERLMCDILYHDNKLLLCDLNGETIERILRACLAARNKGEEEGDGDFLQISGLRVHVAGDVLATIEHIDSAGNVKPLNSQTSYRVATTHYVANIADPYKSLFEGRPKNVIEDDIKEATVQEFKSLILVGASLPDLWRRCDEPRWRFTV